MAQSTATGPSLHQPAKAPIQAPTLVTVTHQRPITSPGGTPSSALTPVDISLPLNPAMESPPPGPAVTPVINALSTVHLDVSIPRGDILAEDEIDIWQEMAEPFED